jgi:hypothetical protein
MLLPLEQLQAQKENINAIIFKNKEANFEVRRFRNNSEDPYRNCQEVGSQNAGS